MVFHGSASMTNTRILQKSTQKNNGKNTEITGGIEWLYANKVVLMRRELIYANKWFYVEIMNFYKTSDFLWKKNPIVYSEKRKWSWKNQKEFINEVEVVIWTNERFSITNRQKTKKILLFFGLEVNLLASVQRTILIEKIPLASIKERNPSLASKQKIEKIPSPSQSLLYNQVPCNFNDFLFPFS